MMLIVTCSCVTKKRSVFSFPDFSRNRNPLKVAQSSRFKHRDTSVDIGLPIIFHCSLIVSVFHLHPKDRGEIEMFRGKEYGGDRRGGVWEGAVPLPNRGSGGCAPRIFFNLATNITRFCTFLPITCVEKEFFTVVNKQDNNKNSSPWTNFCEDPHCQFTICYSVSHNVYNEHRF